MAEQSSAYDYSVIAFNTSVASDNKIHDDTVAAKLGFKGGLVPGVDVYAYMMHPVIEAYGPAFLERGCISGRFLTPVYDGLEAVVHFDPEISNEVTVESAGILCAKGEASMADEAGHAPPIDKFPYVEPPEKRPKASDETMLVGQIFGTDTFEVTAENNARYLKDIRETSPLYEDAGIVHSGLLLRRANRALTLNVELGPWIHVGSEVEHLSIARVGETLSTRSIVTGNYERKGHKFVDLDVLILGTDGRPVMRVQHLSIYEPRQLSEAAA